MKFSTLFQLALITGLSPLALAEVLVNHVDNNAGLVARSPSGPQSPYPLDSGAYDHGPNLSPTRLNSPNSPLRKSPPKNCGSVSDVRDFDLNDKADWVPRLPQRGDSSGNNAQTRHVARSTLKSEEPTPPSEPKPKADNKPSFGWTHSARPKRPRSLSVDSKPSGL
ncbi:hypothetical protein PspLS_06342 [Pyricularia sp. CBS 133598]|nr:hypothetical protein PspLS_06342 [Pyricularia sp. CBS 133598]